MRLTLSLLICLIFFSNCASNGKGNYVGQLDMASSRLVSNPNMNIAANMTAEVVYVKDLVTSKVIYRLDAGDRHQLDVENHVLDLPLGRYQIASICADKTFAKRLAGLKSVDFRAGSGWWARFQGLTGTEAYLPASSMEVTILGGEKITPVNLSATGQKTCEVTYGEAKPNSLAKTFANTLSFKNKYRKKIEFYN